MERFERDSTRFPQRRSSYRRRAMITGIAAGLALVLALSAMPVNTTVIGAQGLGPLARHHTELEFQLLDWDSHSFRLPDTRGPVRIDISFTAIQGQTNMPIKVMAALVKHDPQSGVVSWISTDGDGSRAAGSSAADTIIAQLGGDPVGSALAVDDAGAATLKITQYHNFSTVTSVVGYYNVQLWF